MELTIGQQLGGYRILRFLGKGGVGAVYEVEHMQLGVRYALKAFTFTGGHDGVLKDKFLVEGKVLARLHHPNLVRVFDLNFDEPTGILYFVMDLVVAGDGMPRTLTDVTSDTLDEDRLLRWFAELASALDYIHEQGIVHRDVKLGNVLLSADDHVILSDFGVSRIFSERMRGDVNAVRTMVSDAATVAHLVMGTQGYMAPEVIRGEEATPAADSYSLGVMFVYLLTGIWYMPGSKVFALLETLEYRWRDVVRGLLADDPAVRPTNLTALARSLQDDQVSVKSPEEAPSTLSNRRRRLVVLAIVCIAVIVATGACCFFISRHANLSAVNDFDAAFGIGGIYEESAP